MAQIPFQFDKKPEKWETQPNECDKRCVYVREGMLEGVEVNSGEEKMPNSLAFEYQ